MVNADLSASRTSNPDIAELRLPQRLALVNSRANDRPIFQAVLGLDARLGQLVAGANEPILGQMRLAWWRDELRKDVAGRPKGDPVLDLISRTWTDEASHLVALVDGWEALAVMETPGARSIEQFAAGRASALVSVAERIGSCTPPGGVDVAARRWALVDLAEHSSSGELRDLAFAEAEKVGAEPIRLDRSMRPLAVLDGLARRAISRGTPQLMGDRLSPLAALRLGILGR